MDGIQLRDEAAQDRVRAAIEFLDPSKFPRLMRSPYSI
jgi:DNA replication licensing factor MCM3